MSGKNPQVFCHCCNEDNGDNVLGSWWFLIHEKRPQMVTPPKSGNWYNGAKGDNVIGSRRFLVQRGKFLKFKMFFYHECMITVSLNMLTKKKKQPQMS